MADAGWFYVKAGQRQGPINLEEIKALAQSGQLSRQDLVWTVGMGKWAPAGTLSQLFEALPAPVLTPVSAPPQPSSAQPAAPAETISYFTPGGGMPPRAAAALAGHAIPTGDTGDWPLDDARVAQWEQAVKLRKKVFGAAQLYRALFALSIIAVVIFGLIGLFSMGGSSARARAQMLGMTMVVGVSAAVAVLYYFAWRATARSQRWAPLTMFILFLLGAALNLVPLVAAGVAGSDPSAALAGLVGMILPALFAVVSWRAFSTIPEYLHQPAWCQELLLKANL